MKAQSTNFKVKMRSEDRKYFKYRFVVGRTAYSYLRLFAEQSGRQTASL